MTCILTARGKGPAAVLVTTDTTTARGLVPRLSMLMDRAARPPRLARMTCHAPVHLAANAIRHHDEEPPEAGSLFGEADF